MHATKLFILRYRLFFIILLHSVIYFGAYLAAFCARFEFQYSTEEVGFPFWKTVWAVILVKLLVGIGFSGYRGWWKYVSLNDMLCIANQVTVGSLVLLGIRLVLPDTFTVPVGVILIDWAFAFVALMSVRVSLRFFKEKVQTRFVQVFCTPKEASVIKQTSIVIVGAGDAGEALVREIQAHPELNLTVLGFLDDDPHKAGARIHQIPVLGTIRDAKKISQLYDFQRFLIAAPSATQKQMRQIVRELSYTRIPYQILPSYDQLVSGRVMVSQVREVQIEDLLHRQPVQTDLASIGKLIRGKVVMVTGAGGSIGSELCRQIMTLDPSCLVLAEQAENSLFYIEQELIRTFKDKATHIVPAIVDITDRSRLKKLFHHYQPEFVFHAAAHKHVPMMECNPSEAVKNNIFGTKNVVDLSHAFGCQAFVMISTDKAVNPTSVMGTTKRAAELYIQGMNRISATRFITVRFGNVLGSAGSVIPTFKDQIRRGGPVTVTHPEMNRYFMTIPEAVQLVLQSFALGRGGEIFTLDMGEPVKIADLAYDLIRLSGLRPHEDIDIVYTGLRPGEKLYEELYLDSENTRPTSHPKIVVANCPGINFEKISQKLSTVPHNLNTCHPLSIKLWLKSIVKEYQIDLSKVDSGELAAWMKTDTTIDASFENFPTELEGLQFPLTM
ncbi:MAG: polysaccharide biosynthesis protein [Acidobacteria bacterium]|nr:polysaccharide biosynthesis protein [Acidobacteriota bacterium]